MTFLRLLLVTLTLVFAAPAFAQTVTEGPDYRTWESVANRAEAAVDQADDATSVYETLRGRITDFRASFDVARQANGERIATLRSQIEALGPAPTEGESETADIAARRADLTERLSELLGPVQAAEEAYTRATGLIGEIDAIIRDRQTERLLSLGPTPLNPVAWPTALEELGGALGDLWAERRVFGDERLIGQARENLPLVLLLTALGGVLLARGRSWALALGERMRRWGGRGTGVWAFVVSLLRIALPLLGLYALTEAIFATGLVGIRSTAVLESLPFWGAVLLGYRWLAERLFSRIDEDAVLPLSRERRAEARFYITTIAVVLVLRGVLELLLEFSQVSRPSEAVLAFPITAALGLMLYRLGQILRRFGAGASATETGFGAGLARIVRGLGLATEVAAVVSVVMAGIGYAAAGNAILYPTILTLGLLGLILTLQRFAGDVLGWVTGQGDAARESLIAVLVSFALLVMGAPLLALIWGVRASELSDLWYAFLQGFELGETRISPVDFLTFIVVFVAGYVLTRLLQNTLRSSVLPKTRIDTGGQTALVSGVGYVGIFLAAVIAITAAGIDLSSIALVAGALSVGIGFGLQNIVSNFVSGIILLIERPISEGDWIEVGGQHGYVKDISVRSTRIETFDRSDVIVPNSDLVSGTVTNYTRGNTVGRAIVPVGVAYGSDTRRIEAILREIAEGHPMVVMNPPPSVVFQGFGASSLDFEIRAILRDVNWVLSVKSELNHQIAERFVAEGIEIPFPQQDVWLRNPETLSGAAPKAAAVTQPQSFKDAPEEADADPESDT